MNDAGNWDYVEIPDENDRAGEKNPGAQCQHAIASPLVVCQRSLFRVSKLIFFQFMQPRQTTLSFLNNHIK